MTEPQLCGDHGMFYEYNGVIVWPVCTMAANHQEKYGGKHRDQYGHRWSESVPVMPSREVGRDG